MISFPVTLSLVKQLKVEVFKGLRRLIYGKSRHKMLNYVIYYAVHENDGYVDVINILPSRTKRKRIRK